MMDEHENTRGENHRSYKYFIIMLTRRLALETSNAFNISYV